LAVCSMVTITLVPAADTRSMAPPMPFTILPCQPDQ
jgi:hypothetical protein